MFEQLTERQEAVLRMVVRDYIESGKPVGSVALLKNHDLGVSSATIRNELATLGELGYLAQLHTSAGRIPTEQGYRYFVLKLLGEFHLPVSEQQIIRTQFDQARLDISRWMQLAAAILARTSQGASVVTAPHARANRFKHLQLISTQGRLVLLVLVLNSGNVQQQLLTLAEPLPQARLSSAADHLNTLLGNATYDEISRAIDQLDTLEYEVAKLVLDILQQADDRYISDFYRDGIVNLIGDEGTRAAVRVLEERTLLANFISQTQLPDVSGVQVMIGGEGRWEELKDCTLILARYGVAEDLTGTVAVIGPTRMAYGRNVAAVRYVADLMSGFVYEYYADAHHSDGVQLENKNIEIIEEETVSDASVNDNEQVIEESEELSQAKSGDDVIEGEFVEAEAADAAADAEDQVEEPSLEEQLQAAKDEAAKNLDSYLRAQAELANARKRFEKQRTLTYVNANSDMVSKLLPVLDDYERATGTVPEHVSEDSWYQGIELVYRKLLGVLESLNVKEIEALGTPFDPNFHEALGTEPTEEVESGAVSRVMLKGYKIGDKVVRPSLVYVAD